MFKYILICLLLFCCESFYSQDIKVVYKYEMKKLPIDSTSEKGKRFASHLLKSEQELASIAPQINFILVADKEKFFLMAEKPMAKENSSVGQINLAVSRAIDGESIFTNLNNSTSYYIPRSLPFVRTVDINAVQWKISKKTTVIAGIQCYYAEATEITSEDDYKMMIPIGAWFAPSLSWKGGPTAYGTLPGIILQLETFSGVFTAKTIKQGNFDFELNLKDKELKPHEEFVAYYNEWNKKNMPRRKN